MKRLYAPFLFILAALFVSPAMAVADQTPNPRPGLALDPTQTYVLLIGALTPLVTYLLNHYGPHTDEKVKGIIHVVTAAVAGGLYQALSGGGLGFNATTLQLVGTSVISALFAHKLLYAPSGINTFLGGGRNHDPAAPPQAL